MLTAQFNVFTGWKDSMASPKLVWKVSEKGHLLLCQGKVTS